MRDEKAPAHPPWFTPYVQFEDTCTRMHNWDPRCFTGLLQTEDYARAIVRAERPEATDEEVEHEVDARMERQRVFEREHLLSYWFVIGEGAFRSKIGIGGPVTVFDFDGQASVGYAEGYEAGRTIEAPHEVAKIVTLFDLLRASALSPRDSASWIAAVKNHGRGPVHRYTAAAWRAFIANVNSRLDSAPART